MPALVGTDRLTFKSGIIMTTCVLLRGGILEIREQRIHEWNFKVKSSNLKKGVLVSSK